MSQETMEWLNQRTLIGFTGKRGNAWHYREDAQGTEPNHYLDAIPVDDVLRRLFNFDVIEQPLFLQDGTQVPGRKAMVTSDTNEVLGVFKGGYQGHSYSEWLIENIATIIDSDIQIGSAGLLKNRGQAWVSIEVPDTITTPEGVAFRPNLTGATSFDGSLSTTYKKMVQVVVCDNTLTAGLSEDGQQLKIRHSKYSNLKIADAREALAIVFEVADEFAAEVAKLCATTVTPAQFDKLLDLTCPIPTVAEGGNTRGATMATKKREEIKALYANDLRAATWNGNAFGVLQAYNTWNQHVAQVKGTSRLIRNMENAVSGVSGKADADVLNKLALVLA